MQQSCTSFSITKPIRSHMTTVRGSAVSGWSLCYTKLWQRHCQMASTANCSATGSKVWQSSCTRSHWSYMLRRLQRVLLALWIIAVSKHMPPICKRSRRHEKWYVSYNTRKKFWWRKTYYSPSHKGLMHKPGLQSIPRHNNVSLMLCLNV